MVYSSATYGTITLALKKSKTKMATRKEFEKAIISYCVKPNIKGYFLNNSENLIDGINEDLYQEDLMSGSGNELKSKFNAIFSSSALAVNNFAIVKKHLTDFKFLNYSDFNDARFERQFKTELAGTPPNLDFTIENKETIIAFESKYLETLNKKKAKFADSYNKENLDYLDEYWFNLIEKYKTYNSNLDVAQLIKHSIGLLNHRRKNPQQNVILVYLYWTPDNFSEIPNFIQHQENLDEFKKDLEKIKDFKFISLTYNDFWKLYDDDSIFNEHFDKMRNRYKLNYKLLGTTPVARAF